MFSRIQPTSGLLIAPILLIGISLNLPAGCPQPPPPPPESDGDEGTDPGKGNSGLTGKYVGSETCVTCHSRTHQNWSETLHARALDTLEAIGQDTNSACLGCHTVGFREAGGFADRATTDALAGVGCESCQGAARDHRENVADASLRPTVDISAGVCGRCHTGEHHPNFEDWGESGHSSINDVVSADLLEGGFFVNACGQCHSGDVFYRSILKGESVPGNAFEGMSADDLTPVTCAICHDPHQRTNNAPEAKDGRDYQLRFPELATPVPTNTIDAATNPARFNICGQCHHSRGRDWTATSRGPHHSVQSNVYIGEMPTPDADGESDPLILSRASVHLRATQQCATCHLYRQDFQDDQAPAISGHKFTVSYNGCAATGCHSSTFEAKTRRMTFQAVVQARLDDVAARLGDASTWQYSATGGSEDQSTISDEIKKIRFLWAYIGADGSQGIHNSGYVEAMLDEAERLLDGLGK